MSLQSQVHRAWRPFGDQVLNNRDDVASALRCLVDPLKPFFSSSGARVELDATGAVFDRAAIELEGFARPLWGIASATAGGYDFNDWWPVLRRGLVAGTDPSHPDYWGDVRDIDQRMVELAAIGYALRICRSELWDPLAPTEQAIIASYLSDVRNKQFSDNNWKFFRLFIDLGLEEIGADFDRSGHDAYLDEIDSFYIDEGWSRDGRTRQLDHYVAFGFHFYGLLYCKLVRRSGERRHRIIERARTFAWQYRHWFADDGACIPFGRSLTYRFATAAFWAALAATDTEALPWPEAKGLYLRNLRWWAERPIARSDGTLSIGYGFPTTTVAENYTSSNSPYWACKAFVSLLAADRSAFWSANEAPAKTSGDIITLRTPGLIIKQAHGNSTALSSGQSNADVRAGGEKYGKFAYSSRYAFNIEADPFHPDRVSADNALVLIDQDRNMRWRTDCEDARIGENLLYSLWKPWSDVEVRTWLWWEKLWHVRVHEIVTTRPLQLVEGGFTVRRSTLETSLWTDPPTAAAITNDDISVIVHLDGPSRVPRVQPCQPNTNLINPYAVVPQLIGKVDGGSVLATAVLATSDRKAGCDAWLTPPDAPDVTALKLRIIDMAKVGAALFV